jgi:hypothetical protein
MAKTGMWLAIVGGVIAVIGNFWGGSDPQYYLPAIGGVVAVIGGFMK